MTARAGVVVAVILGLVAMAAPAQAGTWDYAAWGWDRPAGPKVAFRWGEPFRPVRLNDNWKVADCDGDAPFICFSSTTGASGKAELSTYPLRGSQLQKDLAEDGRRYAFRRWAYDHYRTFRDDRTGCRKGYTFHPFRPKPATVAGREGVRFGFVVKDAGGRVVERSVTFGTVTKTMVVVVGSEGLHPRRSCLALLGDTFTPSALKRMGPYVARMAATGKLPARR